MKLKLLNLWIKALPWARRRDAERTLNHALLRRPHLSLVSPERAEYREDAGIKPLGLVEMFSRLDN